MTADELIRKFGLEDGGIQNGLRAMRVTINKSSAQKFIGEIRAHKEEILAILDAQKARKQILAQEEAHAREARKAALKAGAPFDCTFHDGEYLSGWEVFGPDAEVLLAAGGAKRVANWGTYVDAKLIERYGPAFSLADVEAFTAPRRAQEAETVARQEATILAARQEAAASGHPVVLARWMTPCRGDAVECSTDAVARMMMPDGSIREEAVHTY